MTHSASDEPPVARAAPEPQLAEPMASPSPSTRLVALGGIVAIATTGALLYLAWPDSRQNSVASVSDAHQPRAFQLGPDEMRGAITPLDTQIANNSDHIYADLAMPEEDKQRLRKEMADGGVRLGAITLWDNVDEDGDRVRIDGAGYSQELTILHKPKMFLIPYRVGNSVRLTATFDGGGGVTLAVRTAFGNTPLPPLRPGDSVEIPIL